MILLTDETRKVFNLDEIKKSGLIRAQYHTWTEPRNGIVVAADETILQVLFLTGVRVATRYYKIKADEVFDGKWSINYTNDMDEFFEIEMTYNVDSDCVCSDCTCSDINFEPVEGNNSNWNW